MDTMSVSRSLLIYFFIFYSSFLLAVQSDSLPNGKIYKTSIKYFYEKEFNTGKIDAKFPDSSIATVHHTNLLLDLHYNFLGTLGSASDPQVFRLNLNPYTFTSIRSYDLQMLQSDSIKSFHTNKRYTELRYHSGNFKEQRIAVVHTQNINLYWNAGINFDRQGVNDFMNFSNTFRSRFAIHTNYNSPDKKYNIFAHAIWNSIKNEVNGGLSSDSLFDNTRLTNLGIKGLAYRISNAEQRIRKKIFYVSQYYDLGNNLTDSSGNIISHNPIVRLHHYISIEKKSFVYSDISPDSTFYSNFYYGTLTYDSLYSDDIINRFSIKLPSDSSRHSGFFRKWDSEFFGEYQYVKYGQRTDTSWNNLSAGANVFLMSDSSLPKIFVEGMYVVDGMDKGKYQFKLEAYSPENTIGKFGLNITHGQSSPDLIYRWYNSNNFIWNNSFSSIKYLRAGVNYYLKKYFLKIQADHIKIKNYVYLNSHAFPDQYYGTISINQLNIIKNFNYKYWHFNNSLTYQKTDHEELVRLPSFVSDHSLYFEKHFYKKALLAAFGLSANYNSSYFANEFMPANAMFYLQNTTKTGGYFRIDLFLNAQIKTARIFLKFENIADDIIKRSYYLTPHYPMPGRVLKFGIAWKFFDQ